VPRNNREQGWDKIKKLIMICTVLLLLAACGAKDFTFSGESEHWKADVNVNQSSDFERQELVLRFKGEDVESVGEIAYTVDSRGGFGRTGATLEENGTLKDSSEAGPNNAKVSEDTEFVVTVEWNDTKETFTLSKE
jgi:hypothetical protein